MDVGTLSFEYGVWQLVLLYLELTFFYLTFAILILQHLLVLKDLIFRVSTLISGSIIFSLIYITSNFLYIIGGISVILFGLIQFLDKGNNE